MRGQGSGVGGQGDRAPHVIRLRGPWESDRGRVKLPCDWLTAFGLDSRKVTLARRFNRPSGLDSGERVLLRVVSPHQLAAIWLNDVALSSTDAVDITDQLADKNLLSVELVGSGRADQSLLEVQLEIS